jgi:hypothetical protein
MQRLITTQFHNESHSSLLPAFAKPHLCRRLPGPPDAGSASRGIELVRQFWQLAKLLKGPDLPVYPRLDIVAKGLRGGLLCACSWWARDDMALRQFNWAIWKNQREWKSFGLGTWAWVYRQVECLDAVSSK